MLEDAMSIEAMKLALEALESCTPADTSTGHVVWPSYDEQAVAQAITALRTAIAGAEKQEPVAWLYRDSWGTLKLSQIMPPPIGAFPVYTTPPAAQPCPYIRSTAEGTHHCALSQRQPLTDEQIRDLWSWSATTEAERTANTQQHAFARAIEAAHGIGEKK